MASRDEAGWPARTVILTAAGAVVGLFIHLLAPENDIFGPHAPAVWRLSLATLLLTGGIAFALTWERRRGFPSLGFAVVAGAVVAGVIAFNGAPATWSESIGLRLPAAILAVLIAAPVFQVMRDRWRPGARPTLPYPDLHREAWTDAALLLAGFLFVLLVWALAWLLAGLFDLIGIELVRRLLQRDGAFWVVSGAATGAGLGLLRDRASLIAVLQRVLVLVFAALAPVLAFGFAAFVLSLPFTGLAPLWSATKLTTPLMVTASVVALILLNALIADTEEDEARHPLLRIAALVLALVITPFALIASASTGLRIHQHGLSPDRLWGAVLVAVACAYGLGLLLALARGRLGGWMAAVREVNVRLALALCALLLLLSTPLAGFDAISAHDQVARLKAGRVAPEQFDWRALRFEFGEPGVRALRRLASSGDARFALPARRALAITRPYEVTDDEITARPLDQRLRIFPAGTKLDRALVAFIDNERLCSGNEACVVIVRTDGVLVADPGTANQTFGDQPAVHLVRRNDRGGLTEGGDLLAWLESPERKAIHDAILRGDVDIRPVTRRELTVGGKPYGDAFP